MSDETKTPPGETEPVLTPGVSYVIPWVGSRLTIELNPVDENGIQTADAIRIGDVTWSLQLFATVGDLAFRTRDGEAFTINVENGRRVFGRVVLCEKCRTQDWVQ